MNDNDRAELLAQAIWRGDFGMMTTDPRWKDWARANQAGATTIRSQAGDMIDQAVASNTKYHSLAWLYGHTG
jgi:hypothetical protein